MPRLRTRPVRDGGDIRAFFDAIAGAYSECHGDAERLLAYRLALARRLLAPARGGTLLEIGCGPGAHLFGLTGDFARAIGVDLSPAMIEVAERIRRTHRHAARIALHAEAAEQLGSIGDETVDAVLCVGALEHMPQKGAVLAQVQRVLRPGGHFACLTLNGDALWYRHLAARLGYEVRHLSSDRFVGAAELNALLTGAGLHVAESGYWRFVARGDMPGWTAHCLHWLDRLGVVWQPGLFRGGLYVSASRAQATRQSSASRTFAPPESAAAACATQRV